MQYNKIDNNNFKKIANQNLEKSQIFEDFSFASGDLDKLNG